MVPPDTLLPDVLPTDRLTVNGVAAPEIRAELRRIPTVRNAITVMGSWAQVIGILVAAAWFSQPVAWITAFFLMGRSFALLAILGHEAAHCLLFPNKLVNDFVGRWLAYYPSFTPYDAYDVCRAQAADLIVLGLHETGGITRFIKSGRIAEAAGINICIHGLYETGITTCAIHQAAATLPSS